MRARLFKTGWGEHWNQPCESMSVDEVSRDNPCTGRSYAFDADVYAVVELRDEGRGMPGAFSCWLEGSEGSRRIEPKKGCP